MVGDLEHVDRGHGASARAAPVAPAGSTSPQSSSRSPAAWTSMTMLALFGADPSPSMTRRGQSTRQAAARPVPARRR